MKKPNFSKSIPNIEEVVEEWKDSLTKNDWDLISVHQTLSEPFIEKWKYEVDWFYISAHQELSEPFIEKWKNKVNWINILNNEKINWNEFSEEFFNKYYKHFDLEEMNKKRPFSKYFCLKHNLDWRWN